MCVTSPPTASSRRLRTLGPKYGKQLGEIRTALAELDGNAAMDELNADRRAEAYDLHRSGCI